MCAMSSRERVAKAFRHEEPDRVPVDYSANPGIDRRLKEHFGLDADDSEGLRHALGVDFRWVQAPYAGPRLHAAAEEEPGLHVSPDWGLHSRRIEHESGAYWEPQPHLESLDQETAAAYPMPSPDDYDYEAVPADCERFDGHFVSTGAGFEVMNYTGRFVGHEAMYVGLAAGEPALLTFIERYVRVKYEIARRTIEAAGGGLHCLWIGEDLGTQRGPRISMRLWRERIRPIHERFVHLAKEHGLAVMIHSCGSSSWAFEDFIEMGIDAVDTLQPEAADMAPEYLKRSFGDRLAFHGCISTAGPVAHGTFQETEEYCRRTLQVMMPGGGYCFAPTHQLQDDSPTENVLAMYRTARECGVY
ncbi:MAG: uroporphyrinogen decarboxylase family protein [Candidatus Brocadiia bacterium]